LSETSRDMPPRTFSAIEPPWHRQDLRVPREDGAVLASLSRDDAIAAMSQNRGQLKSESSRISGRPLNDFRQWTRETVLAAACDYTSELTGMPLAAKPALPLAVTGHQPSLSHTGVWVKNFAVHELADSSAGTGLNLVVDTDTCNSSEIRVPTGPTDRPVIKTIDYDHQRPAQPWENLGIEDDAVFRAFPDRVAEALPPLSYTPLLDEFWSDVLRERDSSARLVDCLTAARHRLERRWGLQNLELPVSRLCCLEPFLHFVVHVLVHLGRFREIHNQVLRQYRRINRVRSRTHPVPELELNGDWLEAPFWVWRSGESRRKHVFARHSDSAILLSDGNSVFAELPLKDGLDPKPAVEILKTLPSQDVHLRSRALTTTLFARLCLGDLFVHGIGGAKYDEMTDRIISRFFAVMPPKFLTLSATLHLPFGQSYGVDQHDEKQHQHQLRDLHFNPQRHVCPEADDSADALVAQKRKLIDEQHAAKTTGLSRRQRRQRSHINRRRFQQFRAINQQLASSVNRQRGIAEQKLQETHERLNANRILQDREFAVILFPPQRLRTFLTQFWNPS
jgi:hypothetical protein